MRPPDPTGPRHAHSVLDTIPHLVWVAGPDGTPEYYNSRCVEYLGIPLADLLAGAWGRAVHPDDRGPVRAAWQDCLRTGRPFAVEYRLRRADQAVRWHQDRGEPVRDPAGRVLRWVGTCTDIDDRKRGAEALARARVGAERGLARLTAVVSSMAEGLILADPDGNLVDWNPAALRLHGFCTVEEVRKHVSDFTRLFTFTRPDGTPVPYDDWPIPRLLRGEAITDLELRLRRLDTKQDWVISYSGVLVRTADGRPELAVLTLRDVTERKKLEDQYRQSQKMEAVGRLAGGIAHDFNNLLTVINGYTDIALAGLRADDPVRPAVEEVRQAGERAARLTRHLLAFSRKQVLRPKALDLGRLVADLGGMLRRVIGEDVHLVTRTGPGPTRVRVDPGQLEQVVMNLAVNARDAMPTGGTLTIEVGGRADEVTRFDDSGESQPGPYVVLSVSDTGHGIPPDVRPRIFEPFFTTKESGQGTGLGLATVYGIVRQSGGRIAVDSEVGTGTTIRVLLPAAEEAAAPAEPPAADAPPPAGRETVLLVEDEASVRALAVRVLRDAGYTVLEAADAGQALAAAEAHGTDIHLLVTDVVLPGLGGRRLAERLAARLPGRKVLFVSGHADDAVLRHGVESARVPFLPKPFTPAALTRKVREVLDAAPEAGPAG